MSENIYLEPISVQSSMSSESYIGSEEDFVDLQELPKFSRNFSSQRLLPSNKQCLRNHSFTSVTPNNRKKEQQIISSYVASNLRRSQSSASYQKTNMNVQDPSRHEIFNDSQSSLKNSTKHRRSSHRSIIQDELNAPGLSRKSSFSYVPSITRSSSNNSTQNTNMQLLRPKKSQKGKRVQEAEVERKLSDKGRNIHAKSNSASISLTETHHVNLRDSAMDLVSDEEHSEAYTAVSLAGTLKGRNSINPIQKQVTFRRHNRKFYIIIAVLCGVILILGGLAVVLALILFR